MAEKFDEFLEDVEKDMRQEKFEKVWKEYGKLISTALVIAIGGSGGWVLWKNHKEKELSLTSQKFMKAQEKIDSGSINEGLGVFDSIMHDSSKTYASLAHIAKAALLIEKGGDDAKKAIALLVELSSNKSTDPIMRDFAALTLIRVDLDSTGLESIDEPTKAKLMSHIVTLNLLSAEKAPWALLALDLKGLILFSLKDYAKASDVYVKIAQTKDCPRGLQARAEIMSQLIVKQIAFD
ncbi:MAG: tetratricopeptide repeat protein [Pseudomonadota bacterium]